MERMEWWQAGQLVGLHLISPGARVWLWMVERLALMSQWFVFHDIN